MCVTKHLLTAQHAVVPVNNMLTFRKVFQFHHSLRNPLFIRCHCSKFRLHFVVVNNATLCGVNEEHAPRLQATFFHHALRGNIEYTRLACHYDEVIVCYPVPARTQTVAVEHCTNDRAIGEGNACRAIPRLHERAVILIESTLFRVHAIVVLPCLRNHHENSVR